MVRGCAPLLKTNCGILNCRIRGRLHRMVRRYDAVMDNGCIVIFGGLLSAGPSFGETAKEIDASADAAMDRFYKNVKDAKEVVLDAKGLMLDISLKGAKFNKLDMSK